MKQRQLLSLVREKLSELLNGYIQAVELTEGLDYYVVAAGLGGRAGVVGAMVLAEEVYYKSQSSIQD